MSPKLHFLKVQNLHDNLDDKSPNERLTEQSFIERRKLQKKTNEYVLVILFCQHSGNP